MFDYITILNEYAKVGWKSKKKSLLKKNYFNLILFLLDLDNSIF